MLHTNVWNKIILYWTGSMCSSLEGKRESDLRSLQDDELSYSYSCIRSYSKNRFQIQNQLLGGYMPKFKRKPSKLFHESGERNNPIFSQFYYNIEKGIFYIFFFVNWLIGLLKTFLVNCTSNV